MGIHVDSVRLLDVDVPEDLKRMMSRQASAEREKRATITKAEGDKLAALNLSDAAATMLESPGAMQLRRPGIRARPVTPPQAAVPLRGLRRSPGCLHLRPRSTSLRGAASMLSPTSAASGEGAVS